MADQRYKNAFKFLLQLLILSQKHILSVKKVVWDGLDVVWRWFGVVWGVSTDPAKYNLGIHAHIPRHRVPRYTQCPEPTEQYLEPPTRIW